MAHRSSSDVRRNQKESALYRTLSPLFQSIARDEASLAHCAITRVELSDRGGLCTIFFTSSQGQEAFKLGLETLKLYRPSLRKALARAIQTRYVPELLFAYDEELEKVEQIEKILDSIKEEDS
jgi:ribosome-binding factor A